MSFPTYNLLGERANTCQAHSAKCTHRWVFNKYLSTERLEVCFGKQGTHYRKCWADDIHYTILQPVSLRKYHSKEILFEYPLGRALSLKSQNLRQDQPQGRGSGWDKQGKFVSFSDVRKQRFKGWGANSPGDAEAAHMSKVKEHNLWGSPAAGKVEHSLLGSYIQVFV